MKNRLTEIIASSRRRGSVYIVSEDFEGTGTPSGWTTVGTPNFDYTPAVIGAQSLRCPNGTSASATFANPSGTCWAFFWIRRTTTPTAPDFTAFALKDSSNASLVSLRIRNTSNGWRLWNGSTLVGTYNFGGDNINVAVWIRYVKGTGGNAVADFYFSFDETRPASPSATSSAGSGTTNAEMVFCSAESGANNIFDKIRVSISPIGSNPS